MEVVPVEDSLNPPGSPRYTVVRDRVSEINMVMNLAAESIQDAYRRYKACKSAVKLRRINSYESMVINLAADTIKNSFKWLVGKVARKKVLLEKKSIAVDVLKLQPESEVAPEPEKSPVFEFSYNPNIIRFIIRDIETAELPNINWNGKNDVYIKLKIGDWEHMTNVVYGAGATAHYMGVNIEHVYNNSIVSKTFEDSVMIVEVYNKNLARNDQLIGEGKLNLYNVDVSEPQPPLKSAEEEVVDPVIANAPNWFTAEQGPPSATPQLPGQDIIVDLFSPKSLQQSRYRGHVSFRVFAEYVVEYIPGNSKVEEVQEKEDAKPEETEAEMPQSDCSNAQSSPPLCSSSLMLPVTHSMLIVPGVPMVTSAPTETLTSHPNVSGRTIPSLKKTSSNSKLLGALQKTNSGKSLVSSTATAGTHGVVAPTVKLSVASAQLIASASASKIQGSGVPPLADTYRVIDEAFAAGMRCECSIVSLTFDEAVQVVDALGYTIDEGVASELSSKSIMPSLQLPMLSNAPLAAVLTKFIKDNKLCKIAATPSFAVSEDMADIAVKNLRSLAEGNWLKARFLMLVACNRTDPGSGRPADWFPKWVTRLTKILHLPNELTNNCSGRELLDLTKEEMDHRHPSLPTILKFRLLVYQHTLRLLEQWWDRGFRPNDHYKSASGIKAGMAFAAGKGVASKVPSGPILGSSTFSVVKGRWSPLDRTQSAENLAGNLHWGTLEEDLFDNKDDELLSSLVPSRVTSGMSSKKIFVEIAGFNSLLQAWVPLNRAYGWGVSMETLSSLASKFAGATGYLTRIDERCIASPDTLASLNIRDCRWIGFASDEANAAPGVDYLELVDAMRYQRLHSAIVQESVSGEDALLVPLSCLRSIESVRKQSLLNVFSSKRPTLADARSDVIRLGLSVKVANDLTLSRACEKYSWWDRPPQEILLKMADRRGDIVSVAESITKQRVGVRVQCGDVEIVDALPLEGLYLFDNNDKGEVSNIEQDHGHIKTKKKKKKSIFAKRRQMKSAPSANETGDKNDVEVAIAGDDIVADVKGITFEANQGRVEGYSMVSSKSSSSPVVMTVPVLTASHPRQISAGVTELSMNDSLEDTHRKPMIEVPPPKSPHRTIFRPGSTALSKLQTLHPESDDTKPKLFEDEEYAWMRNMVKHSKPDREENLQYPKISPIPVTVDTIVLGKPEPQHMHQRPTSPHPANSSLLTISTPMLDLDIGGTQNDGNYTLPHVKHAKKTPTKQPWRPTAVTVDGDIGEGHTQGRFDDASEHGDLSIAVAGNALGGASNPTGDKEGPTAALPVQSQHETTASAPTRPHSSKAKSKSASKSAWTDKITPVPDMPEEFGIMFDPPLVKDSDDEPETRRHKSKKKLRPASASAEKHRGEDAIADMPHLENGIHFDPPEIPVPVFTKAKSDDKRHTHSKKRHDAILSDKPEKTGIDFNPPAVESTYVTKVIPPTRPKSASAAGKPKKIRSARETADSSENRNDNETVSEKHQGAPVADAVSQQESAFTKEQNKLFRRELQQSNKELAAHEAMLISNLQSMGIQAPRKATV